MLWVAVCTELERLSPREETRRFAVPYGGNESRRPQIREPPRFFQEGRSFHSAPWMHVQCRAKYVREDLCISGEHGTLQSMQRSAPRAHMHEEEEDVLDRQNAWRKTSCERTSERREG